MGGKNYLLNIISDKEAKSHTRRLEQAIEKETLREKLSFFS